MAIICALTAAVTATVTVTAARDGSAPVAAAPAPQTVTVTPTPPPPPSAEAANRFTCQTGWQAVISAQDKILELQSVLPDGMKVSDPAVQQNPAWSTAVSRAGEVWAAAADTFAEQIAPGTTPVLAEAAHTAVSALRLQGQAYSSQEQAPVYEILGAAGRAMDALCARLAPE